MGAVPRAAPRRSAPTEPLLVGADKISSGDTAWMLTSTALVLMMTMPGLALVLRRHGAQEKRARHADAELRHHLPRDHSVVAGRLLLGIHARGNGFIGGSSRALFSGMTFIHGDAADQADGLAPGADHPRNRVRHVSADLRDHHAGADRGRVRRSHEILRHAGVHGRLVAAGLRAHRAQGVGADRLAERRRRARLRRRHGRAHQCRHRGPGELPRARQAPGLRPRSACRRTI